MSNLSLSTAAVLVVYMCATPSSAFSGGYMPIELGRRVDGSVTLRSSTTASSAGLLPARGWNSRVARNHGGILGNLRSELSSAYSRGSVQEPTQLDQFMEITNAPLAVVALQASTCRKVSQACA